MSQRKYILDAEVRRWVKGGFHVVSETDTTARLVKPKTFSVFWALVSFLVLIVGLVIYLIYYMSKKEETVSLEVDAYGRVTLLS